MTTLRLREWETREALPLSVAQRDLLRDVFRAVVQPSAGQTALFDVTAGNRVGLAAAGASTVVVRPKIAISRVLFLLAYSADPRTADGWVDIADEDDLVAGTAGLFTRLALDALGPGLISGYHDVEDDLATVRGRIDVVEQLRRRPGVDLPIALRYSEFDADVPENQVLLAAADLLRRLPIRAPRVRRDLRRVLDSLQPVTLRHFQPSQVPDVRWTRLNEHYRPAVELARLLLRLRGPEPDSGSTRTPSLVIDMPMLFEEFVRTAVREALGATESQMPSGARSPRIVLDERGTVRLEPDLTFWVEGRCLAVADVKYKRDSGPGRNADLYQLLAYATATGLSTATLIYAEGPADVRAHRVPPLGTVLRVEHLDLSVPPPQLLTAVGDLADRLLGGGVPLGGRPAMSTG